MWYKIKDRMPEMNSLVEIEWNDGYVDLNKWKGTQMTRFAAINKFPVRWRYMQGNYETGFYPV
jgi:hypothetical protein